MKRRHPMHLAHQDIKRLVFYSHDTFGLGNIRRTLTICRYLRQSIPDLSILIVSGSPMIHSFRIPEGVDYIKLPCLTRTESNGYGSKFLREETANLVKLRSELILCAMMNFQPDLIIVDKKPYGVENELQPALTYIKTHHPQTKVTLLLRDILDGPSTTRAIWKKHGYFEALKAHYDGVFILGTPEVFDPCVEYDFPDDLKTKTQFCGYLRREPGRQTREQIRTSLGLKATDHMVLVTAGGGEDGVQLFQTYLSSMARLSKNPHLQTVLIFGPEMPQEVRQALEHQAKQWPRISTLSFSDDIMSYLDAADTAVSMGGYGTVCELLSLNKTALIVPRVHPVEEQWIRAQRMAALGLFQTLHPDDCTPETLTRTLESLVSVKPAATSSMGQPAPINLNALPELTLAIINLLMQASWSRITSPSEKPFSPRHVFHQAALQSF
ncbi:MAG: glycosyltransferase [Nitrospiraceae bacterium]|nr:glycosyltransferase [Nitrospiraceae bacterium]